MFQRNTIEQEINLSLEHEQVFLYEIKPISSPTSDKKKNNVDQSVPFVSIPDPVPNDVKNTYFWPLISIDPQSYAIPYIYGPKYTDARGVPGRSFYGVRTLGRWHAAIDFFAPKDSQIISCQKGKIIKFVQIFYWSAMDRFGRIIEPQGGKFYATTIKDGKKEKILLYHDEKGLIYTHKDKTEKYQCAKYTSGIYVDHYDKVMLYGEVAADSLVRACLRVGDEVKAGQITGFVGSNPGNVNMLHAEIWAQETANIPGFAGKDFRRWYIGTKSNKYRRDPTKYFDFILNHGTVLKPSDKAISACKSGPSTTPSSSTSGQILAGLQSRGISWRPNPNTLGRINRFDPIIKKEATAGNINPNLVKGIIYSESSGDPSTGQGTSGYKGLMQASQKVEHLNPEISIREGIKHYNNFKNIMFQIYKNNGLNPTLLNENEVINLVMRAYNAGPGTVKKAMEYAKKSGNIINWMKGDYYKRAIFFYGAFSYSAAILSRLKNKKTDIIIEILAKLTKTNKEYIVRTYGLEKMKNINQNQLYELVKKSITRTYKGIYYKSDGSKKQNAKITYDQLLELAKSDFGYKLILYSVEFKYNNTQNYVDKIILVKEYYDKLTQ